MDDNNYELQRQTYAMERQNRELEQQNYELARQNQLAEVQARIDVEALELQRKHYILQHQQTERQIAMAGMQLEATQGVVEAANNVAEAIARGQRAWAEVETRKMDLQQKKEESEEFANAQKHKIHVLWTRLSELAEATSPGATFMLLKSMRDELAEIVIDAVHDIAFLDRAEETKKKIGNAFVALVNEHPELFFIALDYDEKIALAKRLQEQSSFHTFEETALAGRLKILREKYPELNIPDCSTFPTKSHVFAQDVTRLKNLCAILGVSGAGKNEPMLMAAVMTAFPNLATSVYGEEEWMTLPVAPLSLQEANFYYRSYRNHLTFNDKTPADVLQRILNKLADCINTQACPIANLRRMETAKRREIADVDAEIDGILKAKREEELAKREAERIRKAEEQRQEELIHMKKELINKLFNLINCGDSRIKPSILSESEISLNDCLLAQIQEPNADGQGSTMSINIFGNRVHVFCPWYTSGHIDIYTWQYLAGIDYDFHSEIANKFLSIFKLAKDILPPVKGMNNHINVTIRGIDVVNNANKNRFRLYILTPGCLGGILFFVIPFIVFPLTLNYLISPPSILFAVIYCLYYFCMIHYINVKCLQKERDSELNLIKLPVKSLLCNQLVIRVKKD